MEDMQIRYGEYNEYEDSEKNFNDIIFFTDTPMIRARGVTYGGNGVPTWNGENKAYSDPVQLFKEIYARLKKPMYMSDTSCPKFDIFVNQLWKRIIVKQPNLPDVINDGWVKDDTNVPHVYKMVYNDRLTTFAHFTKTYKSGELIVFTFPVKAKTQFQIHLCSEGDWLCPSGDHDRRCPAWDNDINDYAMVYGYEFLDDDAKSYVKNVTNSRQIYANVDGTVVVKHLFGDKTVNIANNKKYPNITIGFVPNN